MTHPAVVECAITGVPDPIRGMVVKATVVLKDEYKSMAGPDLVKKLQDHVKHETAPYKYPRIIEFVDELPKTISGKIRRVEIREKDNKNKEECAGRAGFVSCPHPVCQHKRIYETNSSKGGQQRADPRGWTFERN